MATAAELSENSRQGFEVQKAACTGLASELTRKTHRGCGHVYDETPVGIAVYNRNDPVNLVDPDGRFTLGDISWLYGSSYSMWDNVNFFYAALYRLIYMEPLMQLLAQQQPTSGGGGGYQPSVTPIANSEINTLLDALDNHKDSGLCQSLFADLGINMQDFRDKATSVSVVDASTTYTLFNSSTWSSDPRYVTWANSYLNSYGQPHNISVATFFRNVPDTKALSPYLSNYIFVADASWATYDLIAHETLHKMSNDLDDETIQKLLGIAVQKDTRNIADEFIKRCGS